MHLTKLVIQQESKKEMEFCDASAGPFNYCKISESPADNPAKMYRPTKAYYIPSVVDDFTKAYQPYIKAQSIRVKRL
jgi:hypothetical protein